MQAASFAYLGKSAAKLTYAEAALLAVLPQAPSRNRPDRHPERARTARDKVMQRLVAQGVWPGTGVVGGRIEPVLARGHFTPMEAPLFARLAADNQAGALVHTTIDGDLQRWLEGRVASYIRRFPEQTSAALLLVDNKTMAVRAYVGSAEYGNLRRHGYLDMVQAIRSPGSTLKPFIYGLAMDEGWCTRPPCSPMRRDWGLIIARQLLRCLSGPVTLRRRCSNPSTCRRCRCWRRSGRTNWSAASTTPGCGWRSPTSPIRPLRWGGGDPARAAGGALQCADPAGAGGDAGLAGGAAGCVTSLAEPGAAWIIWQILSAQGRSDQPFASEATGRINRLA